MGDFGRIAAFEGTEGIGGILIYTAASTHWIGALHDGYRPRSNLRLETGRFIACCTSAMVEPAT